jgi:hypothetical protein
MTERKHDPNSRPEAEAHQIVEACKVVCAL